MEVDFLIGLMTIDQSLNTTYFFQTVKTKLNGSGRGGGK